MSDITSTTFTLGNLIVSFDGTHNWTVAKAVVRTTKDKLRTYEDTQVLGYYGSDLESALRSLFGWGLTDKGHLATAADLADAIADARFHITEMVAKLTPVKEMLTSTNAETPKLRVPRQRRAPLPA